MIESLGPHAVFIVSAYVGVVLLIGAIIATTAIDAWRQKTRLAELEAMGVRRRSTTSSKST